MCTYIRSMSSPLASFSRRTTSVALLCVFTPLMQGLTLVHFSAQTELFHPEHRLVLLNTP
jgi:hypothetical protein